jgi:ABC-type lipoprotein release transport system permease subunit
MVAGADLRAQWRALAGLAVLVALFGGTTLALFAGARRTATAHGRLVEHVQPAHAVLFYPSEQQEEIDALRDLPGVEQVAVFRTLTIVDPDGGEGFDAFLLTGSSVDGNLYDRIDVPRLLTGRRADHDAPHEVVLSEHYARRFGAGVGDSFAMQALSPEQGRMLGESFETGETPDLGPPAGPRLRMRVVGIERSVLDFGEEPNARPIMFTPAFDRRYRDKIGTFSGFIARVRLTDGADGVPALVRRVGSRVDIDPAEFELEEPRETIRVTAAGLLVVAVASGLATGAAIAIFVARLVRGRVVEQETLFAVGLTRRDCAVASAGAPLVALWTGAAAAAGVAFALSSRFPIGLARQVEPSPGTRLDPAVVLGGAAALALFGSALVFGVAVLRAWRLRHNRAGRDRLAGLLARRGAPTPVVLGAHFATWPGPPNRAVPARLAVAGVVVGVAGVAAAGAFGSNLQRVLASPERQGWTWNATAVPDTGADAAAALSGALEHDRVEAVAVVDHIDVTLGDRATEAIAIDPRRGHIDLQFVRGRPPRADDEVALGAKTLRRAGVDVGDTITASAAEGPVELRVVGQPVFPPLAGELRTADAALFTTEGLFRAEPAAQDATSYVIARADTDAARGLGFDVTQERALELDQLAELERLPVVLAVVVAGVGVAALAHVLFASVRARRPDLAVLRALGMTTRGNRSVLHWHGYVDVALGVLVGLPVGLFLGALAWRFQAERLGIAPDIGLPLSWLAGAVVGASVVARLCTAIPGVQATRLRPAESLRAE